MSANTFTASNGARITANKGGSLNVEKDVPAGKVTDVLSRYQAEAFREFFEWEAGGKKQVTVQVIPDMSPEKLSETLDELADMVIARHDKALGRYRDPENSNIVVYPSSDGNMITVVDEATGYSNAYRRNKQFPDNFSEVAKAAKRWFDNNPTKCDSEFCLPTSFKECFPCTLDAHEKGDHKHEGDGFTLWWG